jgi:hypothetical protein
MFGVSVLVSSPALSSGPVEEGEREEGERVTQGARPAALCSTEQSVLFVDPTGLPDSEREIAGNPPKSIPQ